MTTQTAIIPFHNSAIYTTQDEHGQVWVAIKPICEHLEIQPHGQVEKLKQDEDFQLHSYLFGSKDGKQRQMMCLPQEQILGWLFTINSNRVSPEVKSLLSAYRSETADAINNYWTKGVASNPRMQQQPTSPLALSRALLESLEQQEARVCRLEQVQQQTTEKFEEIDHRFDNLPINSKQTKTIQSAVEHLVRLMGGESRHYRRVWGSFKEYFGLASYRDLPRNQYEEALEFLRNMINAYSKYDKLI